MIMTTTKVRRQDYTVKEMAMFGLQKSSGVHISYNVSSEDQKLVDNDVMLGFFCT